MCVCVCVCVLSPISIQCYEMLLKQKGTLPLPTAMEQKFFKKLSLIWEKKVTIMDPLFSLFCMFVISLCDCTINGIYTP